MPQRSTGRKLLVILQLLPLVAAAEKAVPPKYELSYDWEPGRRYEYSVYLLGQSADNEGSRELRARFTDVQEVMGRDEDSGLVSMVEASAGYEGTDMDLSAWGLPPPGGSIERRVDRYGRVASVTGFPKRHRYFLLPLVLPKQAVGEGDKWSLAQTVLLPSFETSLPVEVEIVYTFEDSNRNYKYRGALCAVIRLDANYRSQTDDGSCGIAGRFQGRIMFDLDKRKVVDYQLSEQRNEWDKRNNRTRSTSIQITSLENR